MRSRAKYITILMLFIGANIVIAGKEGQTNHPSIGIKVGSWKPSTLDEKPTAVFEGVKGATPSHGVFFISPWLGDLALRVAASQWYQSDIQDACDAQKVRLRPVSLVLENRILGGTTLSPFVSYGILFLWAAEKPADAKEFLEDKSQFGYGVSIGAGMDLMFSKHWAIGLEFQYYYAKLPNTIGLTDDYSGPEISTRVYYTF